jgi:hypothetical protein
MEKSAVIPAAVFILILAIIFLTILWIHCQNRSTRKHLLKNRLVNYPTYKKDRKYVDNSLRTQASSLSLSWDRYCMWTWASVGALMSILISARVLQISDFRQCYIQIIFGIIFVFFEKYVNMVLTSGIFVAEWLNSHEIDKTSMNCDDICIMLYEDMPFGAKCLFLNGYRKAINHQELNINSRFFHLAYLQAMLSMFSVLLLMYCAINVFLVKLS